MSLFRLALEGFTSGTKLYHYAARKYNELKTKEFTTDISADDRKEGLEDVKLRKMPGAYYEHISFFFERPPLEKMSRVFGKDHPFWYPGHEIYEHVVDIESLLSFSYVVVESPDVTDFFYENYKNDDMSDEVFFEEIYKLRKRNHEIGSSLSEFRSVARKFKGETEKAYLKLPKRENFESIKNKYAATVPHVMLYPKGGIIQVEEVNKLIVK